MPLTEQLVGHKLPECLPDLRELKPGMLNYG